MKFYLSGFLHNIQSTNYCIKGEYDLGIGAGSSFIILFNTAYYDKFK
jgi:hypothetical protein